jgi:hypothetical protein
MTILFNQNEILCVNPGINKIKIKIKSLELYFNGMKKNEKNKLGKKC